MTLQVVGAGLGRTGTLSLKLALEQLLGGRCYHMIAVGDRAEDADVWGDAYEGRLPDWHAFFGDTYRAVVDWPAAPFWAEIADAFPDAIILLSERDVDSWWTSASNTIFPALETYYDPNTNADGWMRMGRGMMERFTPNWRDEAAAKAAYLAHYEHVRRTAPPDRLVEWRAGDGWDPICAALGLPVPAEPFPHTNTTEEFRRHFTGGA